MIFFLRASPFVFCMRASLFVFCILIYPIFLFAEEGGSCSIETLSSCQGNRGLSGENPQYIKGYVQCLVDANYYQYRVEVEVVDRKILLSNLPTNDLTAEAILAYVRDETGMEAVRELPETKAEPLPFYELHEEKCLCKVGGIWFPQNNLLFAPLVADPRQVATSAGYRLNDQAISKQVITVSLGDVFPIYRWRNLWRWNGDLQFDVETGIWSVFDATVDSYPLVNSDFHVGFSLSYAVRRWAFRLRAAHQSSHLGDEFLLNHPGFMRVNPSRNSMDFFISHQVSDSLRLYGGVGTAKNDASYDRESGYAEAGFEVRVLGYKDCFHYLYGSPYLAAHFRLWRDPGLKEWDQNATYVFGYEWSKLKGMGRKVRFYVVYHDGFSVDGQFSHRRTDYLGCGMAYGY